MNTLFYLCVCFFCNVKFDNGLSSNRSHQNGLVIPSINISCIVGLMSSMGTPFVSYGSYSRERADYRPSTRQASGTEFCVAYKSALWQKRA